MWESVLFLIFAARPFGNGRFKTQSLPEVYFGKPELVTGRVDRCLVDRAVRSSFEPGRPPALSPGLCRRWREVLAVFPLAASGTPVSPAP